MIGYISEPGTATGELLRGNFSMLLERFSTAEATPGKYSPGWATLLSFFPDKFL
jgi:hypothetical protein